MAAQRTQDATLTLTLSLKGEGNPQAAHGKSARAPLLQARRTAPPLPAGEGRGEGERTDQIV
ncbi:MAG: hypothetical protein RMK20_00625, partial [Verrucomicrobiales bacterium]|nr:hypothetical protein [Verrucomicrobiales bacterium]